LASSATVTVIERLSQVLVELGDHEFENLDQVASLRAMKRMISSTRLRNSGLKGALDFALHQIFDFFGDHLVFRMLEAEALALHEVTGSDVRSHDDDGVLEVDGVA
jgi:hypothetical protein